METLTIDWSLVLVTVILICLVFLSFAGMETKYREKKNRENKKLLRSSRGNVLVDQSVKDNEVNSGSGV